MEQCPHRLLLLNTDHFSKTMITVHIERKELWDPISESFVYIGPDIPLDLEMEHSLVSVSKWEQKYHKSYSNTEDKTLEETLDYLAMMVTNVKDADPNWFRALTNADFDKINAYIEDPATATTISEDKENNHGNKKVKGKIVTSELVYYWMTALNIPFECQYWHFNRLITLIKVCSIESNPDKNKKKTKFSTAEMQARRARMEAARAKYKH